MPPKPAGMRTTTPRCARFAACYNAFSSGLDTEKCWRHAQGVTHEADPTPCTERDEAGGPFFGVLRPSAHSQSLAHYPHGAYAPAFRRAL